MNIHSTATYNCNEGHVLVGKEVRICQPTGEWSGEEATCVLRCKFNGYRVIAVYSTGQYYNNDGCTPPLSIQPESVGLCLLLPMAQFISLGLSPAPWPTTAVAKASVSWVR